MNKCCICWLFTHIFTGILIFKGLTSRRLYKSFDVKGLIHCVNGMVTINEATANLPAYYL
jgi:hypothetical protein